MDNAPLLTQEYVAVADEKILLRLIANHDEYAECERLQQRIWGDQDIVRIPLLAMVTAQENGGLVAGAFTTDGDLVGFVYSFLGRTPDGELKQCSVVAAIAPEYQNAGLGYQLKLYQAQLAAQHGIELITWTFDPLSARNAGFNLNKLGARGVAYLTNAYGVGHGLNAGLETDRLLVSWRIDRRAMDGKPVAGVPRQGPGRHVNTVRRSVNGLLVPGLHGLGASDEILLVTVPANIYAVSRENREVANDWRAVSRDIFTHYLDAGYQAARILRGELPDESIYVLERT